MVVEVNANQAVHWMSPTDADESLILALGKQGDPPHGGFRQAVMVSAIARSLSSKAEAKALRAMITIDGNDDDLVDFL